jgi:hypothetical protein
VTVCLFSFLKLYADSPETALLRERVKRGRRRALLVPLCLKLRNRLLSFKACEKLLKQQYFITLLAMFSIQISNHTLVYLTLLVI